MTKNLQDIINEKIQTGYDPVTLSVAATGVNENNIEILIEGIPYSVSGNKLSLLKVGVETSPSSEAVAENTEAAAMAGTVSDGNGQGDAAHDSDDTTEKAEGSDAASGSVPSGEAQVDVQTDTQPEAPEGDATVGAPADSGSQVIGPDEDGDGENDYQERIDAVVKIMGAHSLLPADKAENGATIFAVLDANGQEYQRGTLAELEAAIHSTEETSAA